MNGINKKQNKIKNSFCSNKVGTKTQSGFTLIELLVVISMISLLSSIILASVQDARQKAKNRAVYSSIEQLVTALELYNLENEGYPQPSSLSDDFFWQRSYSSSNSSGYSETESSGLNFSSKISTYLSELPSPNNEIGMIMYRKATSGSLDYYCENGDTTPEYVLIIRTSSPEFSNLPSTVYTGGSSDENSVISGLKCFALN